MSGNIYIYMLTMALVTYLIRMVPITFIRGKIKNRTLRSFLYYVPYVTLGAMTVPAVFFATKSILSAAAGFLVALFLSYKNKSLLTVAAGACIVVFLVELIPGVAAF